MKQAIRLMLILLLAAIAANIGHTAETLSQIENSVIRLHILADSDETEAQMQKMLVRDTLLQHAAEWIPAGADYAAGCEALEHQLPDIQKTAVEVLRNVGCQDPVSVRFEKTSFPERKYDDLTLPAGEYRALCVEIGKADGQNWWCVMYPSMCIPAASSPKAEDVLKDDSYDMVLHPEQYEVRLKMVETARSVKHWLHDLTAQTKAVPPKGETAISQTDSDSGLSSRSHSRYYRRSYYRCCCRSRFHSRSRKAESK